jgi:hypothetical protein
MALHNAFAKIIAVVFGHDRSARNRQKSFVEQDRRRSSRIHYEKILPSLPGPFLDQPDFALVLGERKPHEPGMRTERVMK